MRYYPSGVVVTDEIALDYSDAFLQVKGMVEGEELSLERAKDLKKLNDMFDKMSASPGAWSEEALFHDERWNDTRAEALVILEALGERYEPPLASGDTFIF